MMRTIHSAPYRQVSSSSVEEYGHYWGENIMEQFLFNAKRTGGPKHIRVQLNKF